MKKLKIATITILLFFLLKGCNDNISELENKITQLILSADAETETKNAELLNDFANENVAPCPKRIVAHSRQSRCPNVGASVFGEIDIPNLLH